MEGARQAITWHMGHWVTPLEVIHDEGTEFANTGIREFANTGNGPTVRPQTVRPQPVRPQPVRPQPVRPQPFNETKSFGFSI